MTTTAFVDHLDDRLREALLTPTKPSERAALLFVFKTVCAALPARREDIWRHFERTMQPAMRPYVRQMHEVFNAVEVEQRNRALPTMKAASATG